MVALIYDSLLLINAETVFVNAILRKELVLKQIFYNLLNKKVLKIANNDKCLRKTLLFRRIEHFLKL